MWWLRKLSGSGLVFILATGCVQRQSPQMVHVTTPVEVSPVSDRPGSRVYPDMVEIPSGTPDQPSASVSSEDLALATAVREAIRADMRADSLSQWVDATVKDGVVTLRGSVGSENERLMMRNRIKRLPGVTELNDELEVRN